MKLYDALESLRDARSDADIDRILAKLDDPEYRLLDNLAESLYGSSARDLLDEPDWDKQAWLELIGRADSNRLEP